MWPYRYVYNAPLVKLILNMYGLLGLAPLFFLTEVPFLAFKYSKWCGYIDMFIHSPGDTDSKYTVEPQSYEPHQQPTGKIKSKSTTNFFYFPHFLHMPTLSQFICCSCYPPFLRRNYFSPFLLLPVVQGTLWLLVLLLNIRVNLNIEQKLDILKKLDQGSIISSITTEFGVGKSTVFDIKNSREKIIKFAGEVQDDNSLINQCIVRRADDDAHDRAIHQWFIQE